MLVSSSPFTHTQSVTLRSAAAALLKVTADSWYIIFLPLILWLSAKRTHLSLSLSSVYLHDGLLEISFLFRPAATSARLSIHSARALINWSPMTLWQIPTAQLSRLPLFQFCARSPNRVKQFYGLPFSSWLMTWGRFFDKNFDASGLLPFNEIFLWAIRKKAGKLLLKQGATTKGKKLVELSSKKLCTIFSTFNCQLQGFEELAFDVKK